jgi:stage III sporulation protein SpoIIIAA
MSRVGFESTIPTFERAKTVHALDRATTVTVETLFCMLKTIKPYTIYIMQSDSRRGYHVVSRQKDRVAAEVESQYRRCFPRLTVLAEVLGTFL